VSSSALRLQSRPYRASSAVEAITEDGVPLAGARVGRNGPTAVFLHGLLGWNRKVRIVRFVEALARLRWMGSTGRGRRLARSMGVRLGALDRWPESPEEVVGRIAPTPLILVHGRDDHFFEEEEAWRLYRKAGEPKRLMLATRFGHAEDGLTAALADRLTERLMVLLGR
jgi:hypothetical protein